ncbi:C-type lectin domain family 2 member D-like [Erythrolamprus reginae]|uniref:C-type lectin domain family 2 member D-like n=1 Tax=Erythrolamprus reginae TaxID=121349 RepID=UPI00396C8941
MRGGKGCNGQGNQRYSNMGKISSACRGRVVLAVAAAAVAGSLAILAVCIVSLVHKQTLNPDDCKLLLATSEHRRRPCLPTWIWFEMKCYYFSDKEKSWFASQHFCSLYNATLAIIENKDKDFVLRYKGRPSHWIGLQRDLNQPWKWINGSVSTWKVLGDGGNCAFLDDEGKASVSWCENPHHWICSKPDEFTGPKVA